VRVGEPSLERKGAITVHQNAERSPQDGFSLHTDPQSCQKLSKEVSKTYCLFTEDHDFY
jgi:hypothetical protein